MASNDYELRMSELASTINGRLATVISKQAQTVVGNVYQATQFKIQPPLPANHNRRLDQTRIEVEKNISSPNVVVQIVPTVTYRDGKVYLAIKAKSTLYTSKTSKTDIREELIISNGRSLNDYISLRKFLSQTTAGAIYTKIDSYLDDANSTLKSKQMAPVERAIVYIVDEIQITQDDPILSTGSSPRSQSSTSGVSVTSNVGTSGSVGVPTPSNGVPNQEGTSSGTSGNSSGDFLDIESVDQLLTRDESSGFLSTSFLRDDEQLLTRDEQTSQATTTERDATNVTKTSTDFENVDEPISTIEVDQAVQRDYQQRTEAAEAQRIAEFSDALLKEKSKPKSQVSPAGTNNSVQEAGGREAQSETQKNANKPEEKPPQKPKAKYFSDWAIKEGKDPNGIIYRGIKAKDYAKGTTPNARYGQVFRYKDLFGWGTNLSAIFSGHSIKSPVDVALLLNNGAIGRFNKNIPYLFEEGSEIHLAITRASNVIRKDEGGVGNFSIEAREYLDANWAANPHWCGLFTNFVLDTNGSYKSDSSFFNITATGAIYNEYKKSPFNTVPPKLSNKKRQKLELELDALLADTTTRDEKKIKEIQDKLEPPKIFPQNGCALLKMGVHWNTDGTMTDEGTRILTLIKDWPGAFIVRRSNASNGGHVEVLLHITASGELYTIGGNTGLDNSDGNGSEYGFKYYPSIQKFCGKQQDFYIYKRGQLNPYTNGIGVSVKKTETYNKYVGDLDTDTELSTHAYNVLRKIMEN